MHIFCQSITNKKNICHERRNKKFAFRPVLDVYRNSYPDCYVLRFVLPFLLIINTFFMTANYCRSEIYNFSELPENEQARLTGEMDYLTADELQNESFVQNPCNLSEYLPLSMFMRTERKNNFTHGIYGLSYFSCYTITLSLSNDCAIVAYKYF